MAFGRKSETGVRKLKFNVGLALSGGGARGLAHIGVLKALQQLNLPFCCVAGTSAGSLVGAMHCANVPVEEMIALAKTVKKRDLLNSIYTIGSKSSNVEALANKLLVGKHFDELAIPFCAVAVDITSGEEVWLTSGSVAKAVSASCAVPALFTPVEMDGMVLVDGGLLNNMPADACRMMGADVVIGVDLSAHRTRGTKSRKLKDTLVATWNITTKSTMYKGYHNSDVVIEPMLAQFKSTSLDGIDEMIEAGYEATIKKLDEIKELLQID